jgi:phosphomethylpyrimidine synthase
MTQLDAARQGLITPEMKAAAQAEEVSAEALRDKIALGQAVLPANLNRRPARPLAIGAGLRTKVNANLGTSGECSDLALELAKLETAVAAGTDSVMDLSLGGDLRAIRRRVLDASPVMVGAVPLYAVAAELARQDRPLAELDPDRLLRSVEEQCREGLDYITVHCGVVREAVRRLQGRPRLLPSVSRGGSILMAWMAARDRENPLYENYDELLAIAAKYDVTLSLGDGFRPGSVIDASDGAQFQELIILGELARRARAAGVQVMIEGPGHVPLDQIAANVRLEKELCDQAPFYLLGPLVTDSAPGYDHITAAIGGALAASLGADFLCYVTPAEHLALPDVEDVRLGVIAARLAGHAADLVKGLASARERDRRMSQARRDLDWAGMAEAALDPEAVRKRLRLAADNQACTMCGQLCAVRLSREAVGPSLGRWRSNTQVK